MTASSTQLFLLRWDVQNNTWAMSEALRPLVLNFDFQRKGKTVYITTGFAGFVGAFTGFRPVSVWYMMHSDPLQNYFTIYYKHEKITACSLIGGEVYNYFINYTCSL